VSKSAVSRTFKVDIKTVTRVETAFLDDMTAAVKEIPGFAERRESTPPPTQPEEPETIAKRLDTVCELMMNEKAEGSGSSAAVRQRLKELLGVVWSAKTIERDLHVEGAASDQRTNSRRAECESGSLRSLICSKRTRARR
jgi:hypothetical protein